MISRIPNVAAVTALALLCACGTKADVMRLDATSRAPSDPTSVEVLLEEPSREFRRIAVIDISDEGWDLPLDRLRERLVHEAAKIGGDAVIISMPSEEGAGAVMIPVGSTFYAASFAEKKLMGVVIVWE